MCAIYVWHGEVCSTYMFNMDSMSHIKHKIYLNKYKTLEYYERPKSMFWYIYVWHIDVSSTKIFLGTHSFTTGIHLQHITHIGYKF